MIGAQWTGIVTTIAIEMLKSGLVEAVICVQRYWKIFGDLNERQGMNLFVVETDFLCELSNNFYVILNITVILMTDSLRDLC